MIFSRPATFFWQYLGPPNVIFIFLLIQELLGMYSSIESTDMTVDCHILPVKNSMEHHSGNVVAGMEWVELKI